MLFAIFFGFFIGTMVKETHIQDICIKKNLHHKEVKKLCSKQTASQIEEIEKKF